MALAVYRMTQLLVNEEGPGKIFYRIRELAGINEKVIDGMILKEASSKWGELLLCHKCVSVWIALLAVLSQVFIPGKILDSFFLVMALSSIEVLLGSLL